MRQLLLLVVLSSLVGCGIEFVAPETNPSLSIELRTVQRDSLAGEIAVRTLDIPDLTVEVQGHHLKPVVTSDERAVTYKSRLSLDSVRPVVDLSLDAPGHFSSVDLDLPILVRRGDVDCSPEGDLTIVSEFDWPGPEHDQISWNVTLQNEEGRRLSTISSSGYPLPDSLKIDASVVPPGVKTVRIQVLARLAFSRVTPEGMISIVSETVSRVESDCVHVAPVQRRQ